MSHECYSVADGLLTIRSYAIRELLDRLVAQFARLAHEVDAELLESLRGIRPRAASVPLFSTVTGRAVAGPELDAQYWYRNVRHPVLFADAIGEQIRAGHKLFLEIGAHPILRNDLAECLRENGASGTVLNSLRRLAPERATLLGTAGQLHILGSDLDWTRLLPAGATVKLPSYPFQPEVHR